MPFYISFVNIFWNLWKRNSDASIFFSLNMAKLFWFPQRIFIVHYMYIFYFFTPQQQIKSLYMLLFQNSFWWWFVSYFYSMRGINLCNGHWISIFFFIISNILCVFKSLSKKNNYLTWICDWKKSYENCVIHRMDNL